MLKNISRCLCTAQSLSFKQGINSILRNPSSLTPAAISSHPHYDSDTHKRDSPFTIQRRAIHCSSALQINMKPPEKWLKYNDVVFPPTKEGEEERPAEVYHQRAHIKYSHYKMNYLCRMIRGMSVDEAKKQLQFKDRLGAQILIEIIEEAQSLAEKEHNVEFKSNMWIAEAFPKSAGFIKGLRKHTRGRVGIIHYRYIHMFVKLREGIPPEHYYAPPLTGYEKKEKYLKKMRDRKILNAL